MKLFERTGEILGLVKQNMATVGPIWRPTAQQWRARHPKWDAKGRAEHKGKALVRAAELTGGSMATSKKQTINGRKVGKITWQEDEADAICMSFAARLKAVSGQWPLWRDLL